LLHRKYYRAIAKILSKYYPDIDPDIFYQMVTDFKLFFMKDNPKFNPIRFDDYIGELVKDLRWLIQNGSFSIHNILFILY